VFGNSTTRPPYSSCVVQWWGIFHLCGVVNKQNFTYWAVTENKTGVALVAWIPFALYLGDCIVWCGRIRYMGSVHFYSLYGIVTVNSDRCCEMLENLLRPKLNILHDMDNCLVSTGSGNIHTCQRTMGILREMSKVIWSHCEVTLVGLSVHMIFSSV